MITDFALEVNCVASFFIVFVWYIFVRLYQHVHLSTYDKMPEIKKSETKQNKKPEKKKKR